VRDQGAISRSVRTLEDFFGVPLFERTSHGLELTDKSKKLAHGPDRDLRMMSDATGDFIGSKTQPVLTSGATPRSQSAI